MLEPPAATTTIDEELEEKLNIDDMSDGEVELLRFRLTIKLVNFDALKKYVILARKSESQITDSLNCEIDEKPMLGSYNLVYMITFSDLVKWVVRIPINAPRFQTLDIEKMDSEYHTMRCIKDLGLPVPTVYEWQSTSTAIGVPFAFISFVPGTDLMDRWHDKEWITEQKKFVILTKLAQYMAKLQRTTFDKVGTLRFAADHTLQPKVGPLFDIIFDEDQYSEKGIITIKEVGPFDSTQQWLQNDWDTFETSTFSGRQDAGCLKVVELALHSIPEDLKRTDRFVLDHVDYNYQNIKVDDDCNITGIMDWDCVRVSAQGFGATRYPSWLTRDWDPGNYGPEPDDGKWAESGEDSPEQLSSYRKHYADAFAAAATNTDYDARETRLSHILEAIKLAAWNPVDRQYIVIKLLHHAFRGKVPFTFRAFCDSLASEDADGFEEKRKAVAEAFAGMWFAEWECEETKANNSLRLEDMTPKPDMMS